MSANTLLTAKQARFIDEYLVDANGTQAAIRAGYGAAGARVAAHRLLTNVAISSALEVKQRADAARLWIDRNNVLAGLLGAVEMAREVEPDLILMDLALPVLDGYEATRLLKTNPDLAATPIVAVTAHARAIDREHAMEAGCDAYIAKPYSIHELYALIDRFLPAAS